RRKRIEQRSQAAWRGARNDPPRPVLDLALGQGCAVAVAGADPAESLAGSRQYRAPPSLNAGARRNLVVRLPRSSALAADSKTNLGIQDPSNSMIVTAL